MPDIREMYPSKYLQAEDLPRNTNTFVTIEKVYPSEARQRAGDGETEVKWMIKYREMRKPMGLWKMTAAAIAELMGSSNTDQWVGRQIAIYPGTYLSFGESKPCINVDKWTPSELKPPATGLVIAHDKRPIPLAAVQRFQEHLKTHQATWDDFLRWLKINEPAGLSMAWGVELGALPSGVLPAMKAYLDMLNAAPPLTEHVDVRTGEVFASPPSAPNFAIRPPADPVSELDIPF